MRSSPALALLLAPLMAPTPVCAQVASDTEILGVLAGPGAPAEPPGVAFYGTDLGWTFVHRGEHQILFGDTWSSARAICDGVPTHDDSQGTIPLQRPATVPPVSFTTQAAAPLALAPLLVERDGQDLPMAYGQVPIAAYSDGRNAVGIFGRGDLVRCETPPPGVTASAFRPCGPASEGLRCSTNVGECTPQLIGITTACDLATNGGCQLGQTCVASTGFCIDPTSSMNDGLASSERHLVAHKIDFAPQDPADPARYRSVATWHTQKFINVGARAIRRFLHVPWGNDYRPGGGWLLVWGRPAYVSEQGREAQLYLMVHRLPIGRRFAPVYYAGVNPRTGWPRWTTRQVEAKPLALDGIAGGSPHEPYPIVAQIGVSWVGPPISKWVMLYAGSVPDFGLIDPAAARPGPAPGAIQLRVADHPWGPWSSPEPLLAPGNPAVAGALYGPGGWLYHPSCIDAPGATCARSDPSRPLDTLFPGCPPVSAALDRGHLYGVNVIDAWTKPDGAGGVDLYWNVSTWNPYAVLLVKTKLHPANR